MNLLVPQVFSVRLLQSGGRVARVFPALLCLLLFSAVPAFADPVRINQVIQTLNGPTSAPDLRLNTLVSQQDPAKSSNQTGTGKDGNGTPAPRTDSVISGVTVTGQGQQLGVQVIEEAEVGGTICDCGEIYIAGGIPKWPFLFLAAVPLIFIDTCCDESTTPSPTPTPTPPSTPTPTPPGVPEPASLVLLGTGLAALGAGVRRRFTKTKAVEQKEEEE